MQAVPNKVETFTLEVLPYPVKVVFQPYYFNTKIGSGRLEVHHFEFTTDRRFREFTGTGYKSHFAYTDSILAYDTIEDAAMEIILMAIKSEDPKAADKIRKKQWVPTLF